MCRAPGLQQNKQYGSAAQFARGAAAARCLAFYANRTDIGAVLRPLRSRHTANFLVGVALRANGSDHGGAFRLLG